MNRRAAISVEVVLLLAVIALPVLIFVVKWGWPAIRDHFSDGARQVGVEVR